MQIKFRVFVLLLIMFYDSIISCLNRVLIIYIQNISCLPKFRVCIVVNGHVINYLECSINYLEFIELILMR